MKFKKWISFVLLSAMCLQLFACAEAEPTESKLGTVDLLTNVKPAPVQQVSITDRHSLASANFAVSLLQNTYEGENCILSPYSVYTALAMTANGADTTTLAQMEDVLGMSAAEMNVYLFALARGTGDELHSANSIWFRQEGSFEPNPDFLQINADYYDSDLFAADFDAQTVKDINDWISKNTAGRINEALESIDATTMMYLINALSFDAAWQEEYEDSQIIDGIFHSASGEEFAEMLCSEENYYLDDGSAIGFMKPYKGEQYSFVAMLPNEGISLQEYISSLSGHSLLNTIQNASEQSVLVTMPKYELDYSSELNDALSAMGMPEAFTDNADLSRTSNFDLKISYILHKTYLKVDEHGTQAGAATIVAEDCKGIDLLQKTVLLDRPFVMGIYDNVNDCFVFLGAIESLE